MNQFRINKACELIKNENYTLGVIASKVGFQSTATFYRNFKRQKGCKPFQWQRENWKQSENEKMCIEDENNRSK